MPKGKNTNVSTKPPRVRLLNGLTGGQWGPPPGRGPESSTMTHRRKTWLIVVAALAMGCRREGFAMEQDDKLVEYLGRMWRQIERKPPTLASRSLLSFALEAAALAWHPERITEALALAEQMQDRDPESRTFGNFRWYLSAPRPLDYNAVEFCMQRGILVWKLYRDRLSPEGRERLERLIRFSVEGIRRHRVGTAYTNIFLMKTWNCIAIGEATGRPDLADEGYRMLEQWLDHTWENGITEYLSPTYYGVDAECLGLIARFAGRRRGRQIAEAALRLLWADIAANWFPACQRLAGAHSRDYDYLTGHGHLDTILKTVGWLRDEDFVPSAFLRLCRWDPPADLTGPLLGQVPRIVQQRWRSKPWQQATNYVGKSFALGSAGACYCPEDKPLTLNFAGGPRMPMVYFLMDARGDPYGKKKFLTGGGHHKAHHIEPFVASVQRGAEVVMVAAADPRSERFRRRAPQPACLLSHLVVPAEARVWQGTEWVEPAASVALEPEKPLFLRWRDVAVGVRFLLIEGDGPTRLELSNDGARFGAIRITAVHAPNPPRRTGLVALWIQAAEGLDEEGFAAFRDRFTCGQAKVEGGLVEVVASGLRGPMRIVADISKGQRLALEGGEEGTGQHLLAVNGRDIGREILAPLRKPDAE